MQPFMLHAVSFFFFVLSFCLLNNQMATNVCFDYENFFWKLVWCIRMWPYLLFFLEAEETDIVNL